MKVQTKTGCWAEENFALNSLRSAKHGFIRGDVLSYLSRTSETFDLIIADPPTFSNSHSREEDWEVQKDHQQLIDACMTLLSKTGTLYFSNNFKKFVLDIDIEEKYTVKNITKNSFDPDYKNSKIHHCYMIQHNSV